MAINKNITLLLIAVAMTAALWMVPQTISVQSQTRRMLVTTFNTNPVRSTNIAKYCPGIASRSQLINTDQKSSSQTYKAQLASTFKVNGNSIINKLTSSDTGGAISDIQADSTSLGLFIGFFALGLLILLFAWMFLLCCCCCPSCCPSKCCQKNQNQQYTKCQLYWPSVALVLLLLLVIITTSMGLAKASSFKDGLNDITCATSIFMDDIINGNVTMNGQNFFIGVTNMMNQLTNLDTNFLTVKTKMNDISTGLTTIVTDIGVAKSDVQKVPTGANTDTKASIQYTTKINQTYNVANPMINSMFNDILGASNNGGIIGGIYTTVASMQTTLTTIKTNSGSFFTQSAAFQPAISSINTNLNGFKGTISDLDKSIGDFLAILDTPKSMGTMIFQLFYGVALGLAVLTLLGVILMTFCDKYKCRYLMYFSCLILFFFALLGFLIAILLSILVPLVYWSCDWLTVSLGSAAGFNTNFAGLMSDANSRSYISTCLTGGSGLLLNVVAPTSVGNITNLQSSLNLSSLFNSTAQINTLTAAISNIDTFVANYRDGITPDITDGNAITSLQFVSNAANFDNTCVDITDDSWVMSPSNTSFTSCSVSPPPALPVTPTSCTTAVNFQANNAGCTGCIDTSKILTSLYSASIRTGFTTPLNNRYPGACAAGFKTYLDNIWQNYYFVKVPTIKAIDTRWTTAKGSISTVTTTDLPAVNGTINTAISALNATLDGIVNPKFGLIAGLNCLVIGQDLDLILSSLCVSNFNTLYITRLYMGISAFGILFALCCIVCSGVRHYKHSERKDKISPGFMGLEKNSFQHTDAAFRA